MMQGAIPLMAHHCVYMRRGKTCILRDTNLQTFQGLTIYIARIIAQKKKGEFLILKVEISGYESG